jgi:hypothetical protein
MAEVPVTLWWILEIVVILARNAPRQSDNETPRGFGILKSRYNFGTFKDRKEWLSGP